jgi:hypothetical protein
MRSTPALHSARKRPELENASKHLYLVKFRTAGHDNTATPIQYVQRESDEGS